MTKTPIPTRSDPDLFALAREVLKGEGYAVDTVTENEVHLLLAENPYFIVAVATAPTIDELVLAESRAESILQLRLEAADVGPKVWDAYLVLLTRERMIDGGEATRQLFSINYDTRAIRRIAQSEVTPTLRGVRLALTPFVAPVELDDPVMVVDALSALVDALVGRGGDRNQAARAVAAFRQGGRIADAF